MVETCLDNRKQRVVLNGKSSQWRPVESGVPQGSVLGPPLFVIFINDLDDALDVVTGIISKFADDTKAGRTVDSDLDRSKLQEEINNLVKWAETWQMSFNAGKCKVLHLGKKNQHFNYHMGGFAPGGQILEETTEEKDVGVIISNTLKPSAHCAKAAKKANQVLGQMSRGLHFRDKYTWIRLYCQYSRCHLDYCAQAYSPWTQADINLLESVQERAVRMVSGLKGKTYLDRLKEVGLTTLQDRRVRGDLIQVWKTLHQKDDVQPKTWFTLANQQVLGPRTRVTDDPLNLKPINHDQAFRKNFWSVHSVEKWNNLPPNLKSANLLTTFKTNYDALYSS